MKQFRKPGIAFFLATSILLGSSCASIVSKSSYPISINSSPSEASITITDRDGVEYYKGQTPATLKLDAKHKFFSRARYSVKFEKEGYESRVIPVVFHVDGWYWGNLVFGGFIGFLIIDPATGAMYKLRKEFINETLVPSSSSSDLTPKKLNIYDINDIPEHWKDELVLVED